jgi:hypothetical protein
MSAYTAIKATSITLQNALQDAIDAIEARKGAEGLVEIGPPRLRSGTPGGDGVCRACRRAFHGSTARNP